MQDDTARVTFERGAAGDLWRNTLSQIPSQLGRLAYLASLRDPNTGRYMHHGLSALYSEEEAHRVLSESHTATFVEWLTFTLEQQKADLDLYLSDLEGPKHTAVETWARLAPYRTFVPMAARPVETRLFLSDLETLLELLKNEYDVAWPDPDA